ncbi:SpoIIE family protein phosphatase [Cellulomonas fimi]|uniref:SpoIIE family protein phosphatase n=1 Tax=Cellulomonas sp. RIT-PI-Y TaxID=3035297 RepID=UPI0021D85AE2
MVNSAERADASGRLDALLDGASHLTGLPVLVVSATAPGRPVVFVNAAFTEMTGLGLDDLVDPVDRLRRTTGDAALSAVRGALAEGRPSSVLMRLPRADGGTLWARSVLTPVRDDEDAITHWIVVMVDVSAEVERDAVLSAEVEGARRESAALGLVARVSDLIMDLEDPGGLRDIADLLGASVVRWAAFYLDDGGLAHADGVAPELPAGRRPVAPGPTSGHPRRFSNAGCDPVQRLLDEPLEPVVLDLADAAPGTASGWLAADLRLRMAGTAAEGSEQVLVLPVPGRHRVLGVMVVVLRPVEGAADPETRTVLTLTARRVGLAVENVRLYAREHRVAETLQRAMLPEQAEVDGLDVWSYYAPNVVYAQVGGDWYDVAQIDPDVVGIVIGDVVGHDVEAAAAMGQLRSVVRAYAFEVTEPGLVLERVDTLVAGMRIPRSAGLVLTTLTRRRDEGSGCPSWRLAYSRAGHLPALLVRSGAVTTLDGAGGPLVGFGNGPRKTAEIDLEPGDVLIFYTDGLIERRARPLRDGLSALQQVAAGATAVDAAGIGEELLARLADGPEDDVAVVVVRIPDLADGVGVAGNVRSRRWQLPGEPASIARARHAVVRTCAAWELGDPANAELVVSELVANAVLHGWGRVTLRLHDTGDGLRIEVEDSNPVPPVATEGHPGRIGGFGMRIVERLADWGWRPSRAGKVVWARVRPDVEALSRR